MIAIKSFVAIYVTGMLTFTTFADFDSEVWVRVWAIWQNAAYGSCLAWASLFYALKGKEREVVRWLFYYSAVLFIWEIASFWTGLSIDNEYAVAIVFGILAVMVGYLSLYSDSSINKKLKKSLNIKDKNYVSKK